MLPTYPLEIFYDGSCLVCSKEIEVYRHNNPQGRLKFVDIRAADFSAEDYGKPRDEFLSKLHVLDAQGRFATGVDAFLLIWQAYPSGSRYRLLAGVIGLPGIKLLARWGYAIFARNRHLLPQRKPGCADGTCNIHHPR